MYEDTPQELVHDLIGEAVFGSHALGRPVIGTAEVISTRHPPRDPQPPRRVLRAAEHRRRGRRAASTTTSSSRSCSARSSSRGEPAPAKPRIRPPLVKAPEARARASSARTPSSTTCASARPASRAPTAAASPPRSSTRSSAAPPRRGSSRRSARSAAWPTPSTASSPSTPTPARSASTSGRARTTSPRRSRSRPSRSPTSPPATSARASSRGPRRTSRAALLLSMESTSARMTRLGKSLVTDSEILSLDRLVAEIDTVDAEAVCGLAAELLEPARLSAAGIGPSEELFLAALEHATPGLHAPREDPSERPRPPSPEMGKVGAVLGPALAEAGHELVSTRGRRRGDGRLHDAEAVVAEHPPRRRRGRAVRRRHERLGPVRRGRPGARRRASRCSTPRTSRSAPC